MVCLRRGGPWSAGLVDQAPHGSAWMVHGDDGMSFVLKRVPGFDLADPRKRLAEQHRILSYLAERGLPVACPLVTNDGQIYAEGDDAVYALTPLLPAENIDMTHRPELHREVGRTIARLHIALNECPFDIPSWHIRLAEQTLEGSWDGLRELLPAADFIDVSRRVEPLRSEMVAAFEDLPEQRIHGDCHGGNILLADGTVSGLIDLDHLPIGPRVYDLAYNLSLGLNWMVRRPEPEPDPLGALTFAGKHLLDGYLSVNPLSNREIDAVAPIMLAVQLNLLNWTMRNPIEDQKWLTSTLWVADHYQVLRNEVRPRASRSVRG